MSTTPGSAPARPAHGLTIGVAYQGNTRSTTQWSGTPASLARGLEETGARVVHLQAGPARRIHDVAMLASGLARRNRLDGRHAPELAHLRSAVLRLRLRRAPRLDGVVQFGTEFRLPSGVPFVTFEDMTVRQVTRQPEHGYGPLAPALVEQWVARQGAIYTAARGCAAASAWAAASIRDDYGVPAAKVGVVGLGANHRAHAPDRDWSTPRLLFVAKDFERKNGPLVLRAFARLREIRPEAQLDLVGGHPPINAPGVVGHGPLPLADAAARARLEGLFERATVLVVPSPFEPYGVVFAEAGAAGIASIATTSGGAATPVGLGGILVPPHDEDAVLAALTRLADPEEARRLGAAAAAHAAALTWPLVAERVLRLLRPERLAAPEHLAPLLDG